MATRQPRAPAPTELSLLRDKLAHDYCMNVLKSTATFDILEAEDGVHTTRLIKLGYEYADRFIAETGRSK